MAKRDSTRLTPEDAALLFACKEYMRITETDPEGLIRELYDLASQCVDSFAIDCLSRIGVSD